jgi:hypothetical protein
MGMPILILLLHSPMDNNRKIEAAKIAALNGAPSVPQ